MNKSTPSTKRKGAPRQSASTPASDALAWLQVPTDAARTQAAEFLASVSETLQNGSIKELGIDCTDVRNLGARGAQILLAAQKQGVSVSLRGASDSVQEELWLVGFREGDPL